MAAILSGLIRLACGHPTGAIWPPAGPGQGAPGELSEPKTGRVGFHPENDPTLDNPEMDESSSDNCGAIECPIEPEFNDTFQDIVEMDAFPDSDLGNCF